MILKETIKSEMHQSVVELGTEICRDVADARRQVVQLRRELAMLAARAGLLIASAGTHPFSHWMDQLITAGERYTRSSMTCADRPRKPHLGLHVPSEFGPEERIQLMNQARYFSQHIYALSTNSPFWLGQNTGFKASGIILRAFPRTGIPDVFESLSEYENYLDLLVSTELLDNANKDLVDIRFHPFFDTLEFRICDPSPAWRTLSRWPR